MSAFGPKRTCRCAIANVRFRDMILAARMSAFDPKRTSTAPSSELVFAITMASLGASGAVMRRREFITLLGGSAVAWPIATRAQQPAMPVVGFIHTLSPENVPHFVPAFQQGLKEAGFIEGQNIAVEYRWARGQYNRLPELAADLVSRKVAVIAALGGEPAPQIVTAATHTIPIVFASNGDPVRDGLVASLARPGGNADGGALV